MVGALDKGWGAGPEVGSEGGDEEDGALVGKLGSRVVVLSEHKEVGCE